MRSRFEALGDVDDPEKEHDMILATHRDAAKKVLGRSKKLSRPWIGSKMWEKIKESKEAKFKLESARSGRLKQRWREEYNAKNNEVLGRIREIGWRIGLQQQKRPLRMVGARSYTALLRR